MGFRKTDIVFAALILLISFSSFIVVHEMTHAYIYNDFDCENIEYGLFGEMDDSFGSFAYVTADCSDISSDEYGRMDVLQGVVEAVGYQMLLPHTLLTFVLIRVLTQNQGFNQRQKEELVKSLQRIKRGDVV